MKSLPPPYLVVSANHDYRSKKRANIHFITDELARRGPTTFLSTHSSLFSARLKRDRRFASFPEESLTANGVVCRLWKSPIHPVNVRSRIGFAWNLPATTLYSLLLPSDIKRKIEAARTVIIESGSAVSLIGRIRSINADCTILYNASDTLDTIGLSQFYSEQLAKFSPEISHSRLPSSLMEKYHPMFRENRIIPHALDESFFRDDYINPYGSRIAAVSVGSMLFDARFFSIAADAFPEVDFHIIGSGQRGIERDNVFWIDEMAFQETIRYVKFANIGIAAYNSALAADYLIDTSMKLLQFDAAGIPAVCPHFVRGGRENRFGYEVGDRESIIDAMRGALSFKRGRPKQPRTWKLVTDEFLAC